MNFYCRKLMIVILVSVYFLNVHGITKLDTNNLTQNIEINNSAKSILLDINLVKNPKYDKRFPWMSLVDDPNQFIIEIHYEDGGVDLLFPYNEKEKLFKIGLGNGSYRIVPNYYKKISKIVPKLNFPYLEAIIDNVRIDNNYIDKNKAQKLELNHNITKLSSVTMQKFSKPVIVINQNQVLFNACNQNLKFVIENNKLILKSIYNTLLREEMLSASRTSIFRVNYANKCYTASDFEIEKINKIDNDTLQIILNGGKVKFPINVVLTLKNTFDGIQWNMELINKSNKSLNNIDIDFPVFEGIKLGENSKDNYYMYPYHGGIVNNVDFEFNPQFLGETGYGEGVIFPVISIFNPKKNGNWHVFVQDMLGQRKIFGFTKVDSSNFWVNYFGRDLAKGETRELPSVITAATVGNWRNALEGYKTWAYRTFYNPQKVQRDWFRKLYTLNMVFHHFENPSYESQGLEAGSNEPRLGQWGIDSEKLGYGKFDYFHLQPHNWCVVPDWKTEARGDYEYLAKGGLPNFQKQVADIHKLGAYTGVYTEGTLASEHTKVGKLLGEKGQWIQQDGTPYKDYWGGKEGEINYNMCVAFPPWQEHMANLSKRILTDVNLDGFYLDQIGNLGFKTCYNKEHKHPYADISCYPGQLELVKKVRAAMDSVNPNAVLYTEGVGPDLMLAERNGSFMWWNDYDDSRRQKLTSLMPSRVNFVRGLFPEVKIFEIPTWGENHTELRHAFFNGNGIYLQIGGSDCPDYSDFGKELVKKTHDLFVDNADGFVTNNIINLTPVDSLNGDVFANTFIGAPKTVLTLWNVGYASDIAKVYLPDDADSYSWYDAWNDKNLSVNKGENKIYVEVTINPRDLGCIIGIKR